MDDIEVCSVDSFAENISDDEVEYHKIPSSELFVDSINNSTIYMRESKNYMDFYKNINNEDLFDDAYKEIEENIRGHQQYQEYRKYNVILDYINNIGIILTVSILGLGTIISLYSLTDVDTFENSSRFSLACILILFLSLFIGILFSSINLMILSNIFGLISLISLVLSLYIITFHLAFRVMVFKTYL